MVGGKGGAAAAGGQENWVTRQDAAGQVVVALDGGAVGSTMAVRKKESKRSTCAKEKGVRR